MFETLDLIFRTIGGTLFALQAALLWRDHRDLRVTRFFALFAIAQTSELILSCGCVRASLYWDVLRFCALHSPILLWWFSLALFDDEFELRRLEKAIGGAWLAIVLIEMGSSLAGGNSTIFHNVRLCLGVVIVGHIAWRLISGLKADLVEERRRLRLFFAAGATSLYLFDILTDLILGDSWGPYWYRSIIYGGICLLLIMGFFWLMRIDRSALLFQRRNEAPAPEKMSPADKQLKENLDAQMRDGVYLERDLSIGDLAEKVGAPEHRLRAYINGVLGYRNFRAFLNEPRIEAAKASLADPDQAATSILVIAMDSGFASLASFNRAFKIATDQTPTAFRANALGKTADDGATNKDQN